jgi:CRP/FNR family transcriptional regulator, cyclic AMP receptor protein
MATTPDRSAPTSRLGLQGISLLEGLPESCLDALARECVWRSYEKGQQIVSCKTEDRDVHLVAAGRVRVTTYSLTGRQVTFRDLGPRELFGEIAAIDGMPRSADVEAVESTLLASMTSSAFLRLLRTQPLVAERMLRRLASLVRELSSRVTDLSTLGVKNRIHAELLRRARESGVDRNTARIRPAPKHTDVASRVGTYREQVTRELSELNKAGILCRDSGALVVRDVARLERLVEAVRGAV